MPQIPYIPDLTIELAPDKRTETRSILQLKSFTPDTVSRKLVVRWERVTFDKEGNPLLRQDHTQLADDTTAVILPKPDEHPVMMPLTEFNALYVEPATFDEEGAQLTQAVDNSPAWMTEYDFWWYVMQNSPQPIVNTIIEAGTRFATKNQWI
jgi:hypothetical protein